MTIGVILDKEIFGFLVSVIRNQPGQLLASTSVSLGSSPWQGMESGTYHLGDSGRNSTTTANMQGHAICNQSGILQSSSPL